MIVGEMERTPLTRSEIMSRIRSRDTGPERRARPMLNGLRVRAHPRGICGNPDFANKSRRVAVFVDGCFWHGCPRHFRMPKSNVAFWSEKISRNRARDRRVRAALRRDGWAVLRIWEHSLRKGRLPKALRDGRHHQRRD